MEIVDQTLAKLQSQVDPTIPISEQEAIELEFNDWMAQTILDIKQTLSNLYTDEAKEHLDNISKDVIDGIVRSISESRDKTFVRVSLLLDSRFRRFRELLLKYRKRTIATLQVTRQAVHEDQKVNEIQSRRREEDNIRQLMKSTSEEFQSKTQDIQYNLDRYKACFENASKRADDASGKFNKLQYEHEILESKCVKLTRDLSKVTHSLLIKFFVM